MARSTEGTVDATAYIQVRPEWGYAFDRSGEKPVTGARAIKLTQSRPVRPESDTITVAVTIRLPKAAFYPLRPAAVVEIPESLTDPNPVVVIAEDATPIDA